MHVRFRPERAVDGVYEIRFVDGETISLQVTDGELVAMKLPAEEPTLVVEAPPEELHALIGGTVGHEDAVAAGRVRILVGSPKELADLVAMFAPATADALGGQADTAVAAA